MQASSPTEEVGSTHDDLEGRQARLDRRRTDIGRTGICRRRSVLCSFKRKWRSQLWKD